MNQHERWEGAAPLALEDVHEAGGRLQVTSPVALELEGGAGKVVVESRRHGRQDPSKMQLGQ